MLANVWPQREPWPALEVPIIMKHTLAEHISVKHTPVHLSTQCSHNYETNTLNINVVQFHILCKCTIRIAERWFLYDLVVVVVWPWESLRVHIWELISLEATPAPQRSRLQICSWKRSQMLGLDFSLLPIYVQLYIVSISQSVVVQSLKYKKKVRNLVLRNVYYTGRMYTWNRLL